MIWPVSGLAGVPEQLILSTPPLLRSGGAAGATTADGLSGKAAGLSPLPFAAALGQSAGKRGPNVSICQQSRASEPSPPEGGGLGDHHRNLGHLVSQGWHHDGLCR